MNRKQKPKSTKIRKPILTTALFLVVSIFASALALNV